MVGRAVRHLPRAGPGADLAGAADPGRHARGVARQHAARVHPAAARHLATGLGGLLPGGRLQPVHPRLRQRGPAPPVGDRLHGRRQRPAGDRPADRLPAHPVQRLQPPRGGGDAPEVPGRRARLGPGAAGPAVPGGHRDRTARALPRLGTARRRHRREPLQLPRTALLPLPAAEPQLGGGPDRRHGRRGHPPGDQPALGPARSPPRPARRLHRAARHRRLTARRLRPGPDAGEPDPPQLHGVRRGGRDDHRRRLPPRTRRRRRLAPLPRLARQLRGPGLRTRPPQRRRPRPVDRPARLPRPAHPPARPADRRPEAAG